jgi:hypothetical protein
MSTTNFWTAAPTQDPKRGFRFRVQVTGLDKGFLWYAKKCEKPAVSFTEASHSYLNHTYYWPARAEWNEVSITFVDPVNPDVAGRMGALLQAGGYRIPGGIDDKPENWSTMSKTSAAAALGSVIVEQISEGSETLAPVVLESWTLNNAWVKEATFGELDYSSDDLMELTLKFRYDWATFKASQDFDSVFVGPGAT